MDKYEAIAQDALWVLSVDFGTRTQGREHQLKQQAERIAEFVNQWDEAERRLYAWREDLRLNLVSLTPAMKMDAPLSDKAVKAALKDLRDTAALG